MFLIKGKSWITYPIETDESQNCHCVTQYCTRVYKGTRGYTGICIQLFQFTLSDQRQTTYATSTKQLQTSST